MNAWQEQTLARWSEEVFGLDREETLLESLKLATWMVEAALLLPEWARGFVLAAGGQRTADMDSAMELAQMFPVEAIE
jgi:hypothetical protein